MRDVGHREQMANPRPQHPHSVHPQNCVLSVFINSLRVLLSLRPINFRRRTEMHIRREA